jgi:hypothetical protein
LPLFSPGTGSSMIPIPYSFIPSIYLPACSVWAEHKWNFCKNRISK